MTHKELDDLFRANSARGDFNPLPEEWEEMTALLDAEERADRRKKIVSAVWILLFSTLIIIGCWGTLYYTNSSSSDAAQSAPALATAQDVDKPQVLAEIPGVSSANFAQESTAEILQALEPKVHLSAQENLEGRVVNDTPGAVAVAKTTVTETGVGANASETTSLAGLRELPSKPDALDKSNPPISALPTAADGSTDPVSSALLVAGDGSEDMNSAASVMPPSNNSAGSVRSPFAGELPLPLTTLSPKGLALFPLSASPRLIYEPVTRTRKHVPQINVGLVAATERISVDLNADGTSGYRYGLAARLALSDKWGFGVSLQYSLRRYSASATSYDPEASFSWGGDVAAHQTNGELRGIEIPLSVDYVVQGLSTNSLYATAGLDASFNLSEHLHHLYPHHHPDQIHAWENKTAGRFGAALQAGFGYRIVPKRFPAIRIGPYVQIPFVGVGHGDVNLYTGGVQASIGL